MKSVRLLPFALWLAFASGLLPCGTSASSASASGAEQCSASASGAEQGSAAAAEQGRAGQAGRQHAGSEQNTAIEDSHESRSAAEKVTSAKDSAPDAGVPKLVTRPSISLSAEALETIAGGPESLASPENLGGSLQTILLLSVVSLAPAVLLMTTCYIRIIVVLSLLRQALGLQSLPPTQVLTSIALFMTLLVMTPVWSRVYEDAVKPYTDGESGMTLREAYEAGALPVREFMARQIAAADNHADVILFHRHAFPDGPTPSSFADVPIRVLLPAFVMSELKVAFLMGFCIYLPFLVVDLVVASVTMSMGMLMLPPTMISLPLKLLLFVLVNGWHLVVGMLLSSF
jgi:flagellar biosynthetic protein FliP